MKRIGQLEPRGQMKQVSRRGDWLDSNLQGDLDNAPPVRSPGARNITSLQIQSFLLTL